MMKRSFFLITALVLLFSVSAFFPAFADGFPVGTWAFSSDPETPVLRLSEDGTALYRDAEYTWEDDGQFILLTGTEEAEPLRLRYRATEKNLWLYVSFDYSRKEGTDGEGIIGVWNMDGSEKSFFEFTKNGRFLEDGVFDGQYSVDAENGSFTLHYPMNFGDTVCYFLQEGEHMTLEYPWTVKRIPEDS